MPSGLWACWAIRELARKPPARCPAPASDLATCRRRVDTRGAPAPRSAVRSTVVVPCPAHSSSASVPKTAERRQRYTATKKGTLPSVMYLITMPASRSIRALIVAISAAASLASLTALPAEAAVAITWTQQSPSASPPSLYDSAMAYDSARGRTALFGGQATGGSQNGQTWEWDGSTGTRPPWPPTPLAESASSSEATTPSDIVLTTPGNGTAATGPSALQPARRPPAGGTPWSTTAGPG